MDKVDAIIIGAGVIGLAVAARLSYFLSNVVVIDKNLHFGEETSSRNSEVIHAGIYYPQHSLKAKLCVEGKKKLYQYCQQRHIPFNPIGKLLVASGEQQQDFLAKTMTVADNNGVNDLSWLSQKELHSREPEISATAALLSPSTGIIDVHSYMQSLLAELEHNGGIFIGQTTFLKAETNNSGFVVDNVSQGHSSQIQAQYLINCAGLHSDKVANNIQGLSRENIPKIHWCRGHYFSYQGKSPFSQLVYPIPKDNGLGIHASIDVGGQLKFGPDTQYVDDLSYQFPENLKQKFAQEILHYFPRLDMDKLHPAYAGIRPKLQGEGQDFKDFVIQDRHVHGIKGLVNLFGIDSPGLTSSLAIADNVLSRLDFC
ncbi:MAG: NAD(P)/FAD-dependent oxidoreductase [Colwellia sp.]|nr:NAD(P)/FAD-dependent oxidoreductase [Colwellia sp.]